MESSKQAVWQQFKVASPLRDEPVQVVAARGVRYRSGANRLQSLNLYLPATESNLQLVGRTVSSLPGMQEQGGGPAYWVHVHGGAWRDPHLSATSIEPAVALAYADSDALPGVKAIIGLNYTLTKFPTHPDDPYDPEKNHHSDPAREAVHPQHVQDVLSGFADLRTMGLTDGSFVLSSHSCGACIAFQAMLQPSAYYGLDQAAEPPVPAALIGLNGLYDLPSLVHDLGPAHANMSADYRMMLENAFGMEGAAWEAASPPRFNSADLATRVGKGKAPRLVLLDGSTQDQLVPMNQLEFLHGMLRQVEGLSVLRGRRCVGYHALPWEGGRILLESVQDVLAALGDEQAR